ncbi:MAG: transketolase [Coxiella sp. RIFCSPHIGHO2_12_FULL_42_15]|nr:MAG: transketolase [Coxiella sp. RIFCSPHIGHO2_12_FULL_42_15]
MIDIEHTKQRCNRYRHEILDISQQVGALHIAPAFSCLEMTDVIYHHLMRRDQNNCFIDTFLMSKGHGCMSQYVMLREFGLLSDEDLLNYCRPNGRLGAHPDYGLPGIAASTGSLGHGLGIATGIALANRLQKQDSHTYVILSDGELQEGSTWEAILMAANLKLENLTVFLDLNDFSGLARMSTDHPAFYPVVDKLSAFGWSVQCVDGHESEAIYMAAKTMQSGKPHFVVCHTVKGKGISYMEHVPIWHYRSPNPEEYQQAKRELAEALISC